ncbi:acyltransferase family protein [Sphingomonas sp. PB4P5]|uniref:acyltransferase family protein n=1 Tax=Parasphingomonas puruogangriensis TaxID=3096155 RepID=UPI002FC82B79
MAANNAWTFCTDGNDHLKGYSDTMMIEKRNGSTYVPAIDGLRAIAIIAVVVFHLQSDWLPGGLAGVDIFFVISGFVVTRSMVSRPHTGFVAAVADFYARRLLRIMPPLVVMLLSTSLAYCLFVPDAWLSGAVKDTARAAFLGLSNVVLGNNSDTYFSPGAALNPFTHTWSLGVEEQFYLIFPFLFVWARRGTEANPPRQMGNWAVFFVTMASLLTCAILAFHDPLHAFYSIASRFWELGTGMLLCLAMPYWRGRLAAADVATAKTIALAGAGLVCVALVSPSGPTFPFPMAMVAVAGTAVLLAVVSARPHGVIAAALRTPISLAVGRGSYSIYLWHWPVIVLFSWTIGIDQTVQKLSALCLSLMLAWASYRMIERPIRRSPALAKISGGRMVLAGLAVISLSLGCAATMFSLKGRISLSRTADQSVWFASNGNRHVGPPSRYDVEVRRDKMLAGEVSRWVPTKPSGHQVFVMGDSHSLTYYPALRRFAEDTGATVSAYFVRNCSFLPLSVPMSELVECDHRFYAAALIDIQRRGKSGDVVFLPNLRMPRFVDQMGPVPGSDALGLRPDASARLRRRRATAEAIRTLAPLSRRGFRIVFESPTPVFRSVALRCSDWFNHSNPVCEKGPSIARSDLDILRNPPLAQMKQVADALPSVRVWDAFDLLCPGRQCSAFRGLLPLFMDGDHLSGYGQQYLYPRLKRELSPG